MQNKSHSKNQAYYSNNNNNNINNTNNNNINNGNNSFSSHNNSMSNNPSIRLSPTEYDAANKHMKDRFIYALAKSLGSKITVTTNTDKITGILQSISEITDTIPSIILKYPTQDNIIYDNETLLIPSTSIQMLSCEHVDFTPTPSSKKSTLSGPINASHTTTTDNNDSSDDSKKGFKIDTDISNINASKTERDLQKWVPDDIPSNSVDKKLKNVDLSISLENDSNATKNWDQFKVNKDKFGIDAQFDENDYTVKLNVSNPEFNERMKFAETVSKEIMSQSTNGNLHVAEERGLIVEAENIDEEDKYSGVLRENKESEQKLLNMLKTSDSSKPPAELKHYSEGQYIPPTQRAAQFHKDPAVLSSSAISKPKSTSISSNLPSTKTPAAQIPAVSDTDSATSNSTKISSSVSTNLPEKPVVKEEIKKSTPVSNSTTATTVTSPTAVKNLNTASMTPATSASSATISSPASSSVPMKPRLNKPEKQQPQPQIHSPIQQFQQPQQHNPYQPQYRSQARNQFQPQQQQPQPPINQNYHFKNQYNNNQQYSNYQGYHNNTNNNSNQRHKKSQFVLLHVSKDKSHTEFILNGKFNILFSARKEANEKSGIISMVPSFKAPATWPDTTSESYVDIALKNLGGPVNVPIAQPMFIPQINAYPQHMPMHQGMMQYQVVYQQQNQQYGMFIPANGAYGNPPPNMHYMGPPSY
jgi:PAB1-binding protein PBP1